MNSKSLTIAAITTLSLMSITPNAKAILSTNTHTDSNLKVEDLSLTQYAEVTSLEADHEEVAFMRWRDRFLNKADHEEVAIGCRRLTWEC